MLTVFFDWEGVVHHKYDPPGQTINKEYYLNVLCWLRDAIRWKWPQLWTTGDWQLHHNNTPLHASRLMQSFLVKHQVTQVTQPLYSPDLFGPLWLLALTKIKITFEREKISDHQWDSGKYDGAAGGDWENCVRSQGAYFEGDWVIVLCTMFLVSCIFFNKYVYFLYYMAGYLLDRPHMY